MLGCSNNFGAIIASDWLCIYGSVMVSKICLCFRMLDTNKKCPYCRWAIGTKKTLLKYFQKSASFSKASISFWLMLSRSALS